MRNVLHDLPDGKHLKIEKVWCVLNYFIIGKSVNLLFAMKNTMYFLCEVVVEK